MRALHSEALVLQTGELGESDRTLRLLTSERGRVVAVAKGAKRSLKRFFGTLDLFNHLHVQLERRPRSEWMRLEQARLLHPFPELRTGTRRYALACYLVELVDRLAPEGGDPGEAKRLFGFCLGALRLLERSQPDLRLRTLLELRAFAMLGLRPELERCVRCGGALGNASRVAFHVGEGGALCARCLRPGEATLELQLGTLRALAQGLRLPLEGIHRLALGPVALREARLLATRFHRFHLGFELRSEPFLERVLASRGLATAPAARP